MNYKIGKLKRGLEIAYELQNRILFENFDLEKGLHVFLTVSESLKRKDDINWVKGELTGWHSDDRPSYRKIICRVMHNESPLKFPDGKLFTDYFITTSYPKLKYNIDNMPSGERVLYSLSNNLKEELPAISDLQLNDTSTISIHPADLYELFSHLKIEMLNRLL